MGQIIIKCLNNGVLERVAKYKYSDMGVVLAADDMRLYTHGMPTRVCHATLSGVTDRSFIARSSDHDRVNFSGYCRELSIILRGIGERK